MEVRHNASLIITGAVICLFIVFIVLAAFIHPDAETANIQNNDARAIAESMAQMMWWMTVALITLPVMLLLIVIAAYLFITAHRPKVATAPSSSTYTAPSSSKPGLFGGKSASPGKIPEAANSSEVLDLRYARGEITRDQYMSMKADMKTPRL